MSKGKEIQEAIDSSKKPSQVVEQRDDNWRKERKLDVDAVLKSYDDRKYK